MLAVKNVWAMYFSPTETTRKIVCGIASGIADQLGVKFDTMDFTLPGAREKALRFGPEDLVVFGTPVYAGRVPNLLLKYLATIEGSGAAAIPVVLFGNRSFDDALIELRDILERQQCHTVAAAAFVGEHAFSDTLAKDRPDEEDMALVQDLVRKVADKLAALSDLSQLTPIPVSGTPYPYSGYYQPRDTAGNPVDIRKVKPKTTDDCDDCKVCAEFCPMGSIDYDHVKEVPGVCIKCGACIKKCPQKAKYFDDPGFVYHKVELEEGLTRRAEPALFV